MASFIDIELPTDPSGDITEASVTRVIDGDTIEVEISGSLYKVRYIGIDTPERDEPGYHEAAEINADFVLGKTVVLENDISEIDRYGRLLRYVWIDEYMVNAVIVGSGYAEAIEYPPDLFYADLFDELEDHAYHNSVGLWEFSDFKGFGD